MQSNMFNLSPELYFFCSLLMHSVFLQSSYTLWLVIGTLFQGRNKGRIVLEGRVFATDFIHWNISLSQV